MHFTIQCVDKPDSVELRMATRPTHLEYLKSNQEKFVVVGPVLDGEGKPRGSLYVIDMPDRASAEAFIMADPYAKAGLFESVVIRPMRIVFKDGQQVAG
ncbi:YciI family protein [Elioraea rosea]|uniref:YciI family protein n=1 Tax=Elioraea rosea TaxID=2492390 RepID=UPI0011833B9D|nr:YciI family protein [Elioraea rosea]